MLETPDSAIRRDAITNDGSNIVVTAGAGTGKTTLIVDRILHLLFGSEHPVTINEIVTLTFTNKAASELKQRLRDHLRAMQESPRVKTLQGLEKDGGLNLWGDWQQRTVLAPEDAGAIAARTLTELEKSQIGTIHSFASHVLRMYPVESGMNPNFQEDEGEQFDEFFRTEWIQWLEGEFNVAGPRSEDWKHVLRKLDIRDLEALARNLCGDMIALEEGTGLREGMLPTAPIRAWLKDLLNQAGRYCEVHPKQQTLERMLAEAARYLTHVVECGFGVAFESDAQDILDRAVPAKTAAWTSKEYVQAKELLNAVRSIRRVSLHELPRIVSLLLPFVISCRKRFTQQGYLSFDALLVQSRNLLRDHLHVRQELKRQYRAVLVDEFQDTDPVQYEMLLYLCEEEETAASNWKDVRLAKGKLFIVGDPKQSIYAFRRADMEAYDRVVQDKVLAHGAGGRALTLRAHFRSHRRFLDVLNAFFSRMFPSDPLRGIQPTYDPLQAMDDRVMPLPHEHMEIRIVRPKKHDSLADEATAIEAEALARWIAEEVLYQQEIMEQGVPVIVKPRHIAVLLRTLTSARSYVEAFRKYDIPCMAEGEKHFYERQEVMDAVNLLRAVVNPYDHVALVGVLRSALGGIPDSTIEALVRNQYLDFTKTLPEKLTEFGHPGAEKISPLFDVLRELHHVLPSCSVSDAIHDLYARVPLVELAAASMDHEQAAANLLKLKGILLVMARRPSMTLRRLVAELSSRINDPPQEGEQSLTEELEIDGQQGGSLRLLSIHKAKGLEFPMVVLAGLHRTTPKHAPRTFALQDWGSGVVGIKAGNLESVGGIFHQFKQRERERAEHRRILYVGMTRAKRRLILSGAAGKNIPSDSYLALIGRTLDFDPMSETITSVSCGPGTVPVTLVREQTAHESPKHSTVAWSHIQTDMTAHNTRWTARTSRAIEVTHQPMFSGVTTLKVERNTGVDSTKMTGSSERHDAETNRLIGVLAHAVLEKWDFSQHPQMVQEVISSLWPRYMSNTNTRDFTKIREELSALFCAFFESPIYAELQRADVIGREMPFAIKGKLGRDYPGTGVLPCIVEGTIDLLYALDGTYWIADYKTDHVTPEDLNERVEEHRTQVYWYHKAVKQSLPHSNVGFKFIFLRPGLTVTVDPERGV